MDYQQLGGKWSMGKSQVILLGCILFFSHSALGQTSPDCLAIERHADDFSGVVKLNSPLSDNEQMLPMIIYKRIEKGNIKYFLSLSSSGNTAIVDASGVDILFTDGSKWTRPEKINVEASDDSFAYKAIIPLSKADAQLFARKLVKKYKLYIFESEPKDSDSFNFQKNVRCVIKQ